MCEAAIKCKASLHFGNFTFLLGVFDICAGYLEYLFRFRTIQGTLQIADDVK